MNEPATEGRTPELQASRTRNRSSKIRGRRRIVIITVAAIVVASGVACAAWLGTTASAIKSDLEAATSLIPSLKEEISATKTGEAAATVEQIRSHTSAAKESSNDPVWALASTIPGLGSNFSAVAEVARSADDVTDLGLEPLVKVYASLDWDSLLPSSTGTNLEPLKTASPSISSAAHAVRLSAERLNQIDATK